MKKENSMVNERGQALVLIVIGIIVLIGMTALAIDGGNAFSDRRHAQNAADTAVLAAALAKVRDNDWINAGLGRAADNGYNNDNVTNTVRVSLCNAAEAECNLSPSEKAEEYIEVIIVSHVQTYFAPIVGVQQITNRVQAVAHAKPPELTEMVFGNAIAGLAPTACQAVRYQGNANTLVTGSGVFVNSNCDDSAFFNNSGTASLSIPDGALNSVGGVVYKPGAVVAGGGISSGAIPISYPPPYTLPNPAQMCSGAAQEDGNTLTGGNWSGNKFPPDGITVLADNSVFCVNANNGFTMNAGETLSGHNVTIVMVNGNVTWNGGATLNLDAPDNGSYKGLLLYVPMTNSATIGINGSSSSSFTGTFLAPSSDIQVNGSGNVSGMNSQIIGYTVDLSGDSATHIHYDDAQNWDAPIPAQIELTR